MAPLGHGLIPLGAPQFYMKCASLVGLGLVWVGFGLGWVWFGLAWGWVGFGLGWLWLV